MSKTKEEIMQQWREVLAESARTAVEALSADIPIDKPTSPLDERIHKLGQAILRIRELVRPEPKSVAFLEEESWYRMNGAAKPAGVFHTPKEIIDFVTANPPIGEVNDAPTPIDPSAPEMVNGGGGMRQKTDEDHMSRPEAAHILCRMATSRKVDVDGVVALQMGVKTLLKRHFDKQRNRAKCRARAANAERGDLCHED